LEEVLNENMPSMKLYEKILEVGSQIISCEKCLNAKYRVVEKSLEEGVIPRTLFAEPFLVDDYQNAREILKDVDKARLIVLGTAPNQVLSFERVLYKQLLMHMNVLNGSVKLSNEKARSVFEKLHDVWLDALGGWYFECKDGIKFREEFRRKFRSLRYIRRVKEFLAYLYCYGNPLELKENDVIIWGELIFCQLSKKSKIEQVADKCVDHLEKLASCVDIVLVTSISELLEDAGERKQLKEKLAKKLCNIFKEVPIIVIPHLSRGRAFSEPCQREEWRKIAEKMKSALSKEKGIHFINTKIRPP